MRITLIIGQYPESYEGQYMPNVLEAWDEFTLEDNYEGFDSDMDKYRAMVAKGDLVNVRTLDVVLPDEVVTDLFVTPERPTLWKQVDR